MPKFLSCLCAASLIWASTSAADERSDPIDYLRDIRPLLADRCFACHGPDAAAREANLRLDRAEHAQRELDSGARAIVPGQPSASELLRRIFSNDADEQMPPADSGEALTDDQRQLLHDWIEQGGTYARHWSLVAPQRPELPRTEGDDWANSPIDRFVLRRLAGAGLAPNPEASPETLIRRVSLDVRGLPPDPSEIDKFLRDSRPDAYARLVERMLASPRYGERMATQWLDLARYGDTNGFHSDSHREMWLYRDYVIWAFNENIPFDRFVVENVAGDLLPEATDTTRIASGFNRCNTFNEEGGADPEEFFVAYAVDRTNTFGQVFLGLTVGCAQCHDHKYDPLSQREYYQLYAFFNSVAGAIGAGGPSGYHGKPLPPLLKTASRPQQFELVKLTADRAVLEQELRDLHTEFRWSDVAEQAFEAWVETARQQRQAEEPSRAGLVLWLDAEEVQLRPTAAEVGESPAQSAAAASERVLTVWRDKSGFAGDAAATGDPQWRPDAVSGRPVVRLDGGDDFLRTSGGAEALQGDYTAAIVFRPTRLDGDQMLLTWGEEADGKRRAVWKTAAGHLLSFNGYNRDSRGTRPLVAEQPQLALVTKHGAEHLVSLYLDGRPAGGGPLALEDYSGTAITIGANNGGQELAAIDLAELLIYDRSLSEEEQLRLGRYLSLKYELTTEYLELPVEIARLLANDSAEATLDPSRQLRAYFLEHVYPTTAAVIAPVRQRLAAVDRRQQEIESSFSTTMVMVEQEPRKPAYLLLRGDFQQPSVEVEPEVPDGFPRLRSDLPRSRLALAHWLTTPDHPLTARVTANRLWQQLFGTALVKTMGDFGTQGELPSHPELLDWLAVELLERGWDLKALQREILLSSTYRQSAANDHRGDAVDPENRLLWRAHRFRLSAEEVRDAALAVSGLLHDRIGGASVRPYQPAGYYGDKVGGSWKQSGGADLFRRGLYTYWRRTTPYPAYQIFDAPSREFCTVQRPRTNTPLQALITLNDLTYVEAARGLAQLVLRHDGGADSQRLAVAFRRVTGRWPRDAERDLLRATLAEQRDHFRQQAPLAESLVMQGEVAALPGVDRSELAAWMGVAQVLLNLDEAITRE